MDEQLSGGFAMKVTGECDLFDSFETGGRFRLFLAPSLSVITLVWCRRGVAGVPLNFRV